MVWKCKQLSEPGAQVFPDIIFYFKPKDFWKRHTNDILQELGVSPRVVCGYILLKSDCKYVDFVYFPLRKVTYSKLALPILC